MIDNLEKQGKLDNPLGYYLQSAGLGAIGGLSMSAIYHLIHAIRTNIKEQEEAARENEASENTLVLKLPQQKLAEVKGGPCTKIVKEDGVRTKETKDDELPRDTEGRFRFKTAQSSSEWALATVISALGAVGGHKLLTTIYDKHRANILKKELDKAQKEYLDQIMPQPDEDIKYGSAEDAYINSFAEAAFGFDKVRDLIRNNGLNKEARRRPSSNPLSLLYDTIRRDYRVNLPDRIIGGGLLAWLGGTGATAYITKKILDAHRKQLEGVSTIETPRIKRIVVRSLPPSTDPKQKLLTTGEKEELLTEDEANSVKAAFWVTYDQLSDNPTLHKNKDTAGIVEKVAKTVPLDTLLNEGVHPEMLNKIMQTAWQRGPLEQGVQTYNEASRGLAELARRAGASPERVEALAKGMTPEMMNKLSPQIISAISEMAKGRQVDPSKVLSGDFGELFQGFDTNKFVMDALGSHDASKWSPAAQKYNEWINDPKNRGSIDGFNKYLGTNPANVDIARHMIDNTPLEQYHQLAEAAAGRPLSAFEKNLAYYRTIRKGHEAINQMTAPAAPPPPSIALPAQVPYGQEQDPVTGVWRPRSIGAAQAAQVHPNTQFANVYNQQQARADAHAQQLKNNATNPAAQWLNKPTSVATPPTPIEPKHAASFATAPVVKHAQVEMLKELLFPRQDPPEAPPDYERNRYIAHRALKDIKLHADDPAAREFLTDERQAIILKAIQEALEQEYAKRK